ncbi:MAG: GNAT family N-acetyltransferase [Akkermansiaceae bacterium]|nr:GNAT family N-acetyltransferase [Akkermansiaceae bacterium]
MMGTPLRSIRATISLFGLMDRKRKTLMPDPYWYLATLGVDPPYQSRGLGTLLVTEGLDRADADHTPAYLETETESNVAFYRGLGFEVVEELTIERLGIPLWLMARDAR